MTTETHLSEQTARPVESPTGGDRGSRSSSRTAALLVTGCVLAIVAFAGWAAANATSQSSVSEPAGRFRVVDPDTWSGSAPSYPGAGNFRAAEEASMPIGQAPPNASAARFRTAEEASTSSRAASAAQFRAAEERSNG